VEPSVGAPVEGLAELVAGYVAEDVGGRGHDLGLARRDRPDPGDDAAAREDVEADRLEDRSLAGDQLVAPDPGGAEACSATPPTSQPAVNLASIA